MGSFRHIYPKKERLLFDGGLNNKFERALIEDNESPDCLNVMFQNGAVETRDGFIQHNTQPVALQFFDGLYTRRARDLSETMVAFIGGSAWQLVGTTFTTIPSAQGIYTINHRFGAAMQENYLFSGNGFEISYKWNGAEWTRHGAYPPTTTMSVASNGAGFLMGGADYRYKMTWVNSQLVESDVSPVTTTFTVTATSGQLRVSNLPIAPQSFGINTRNIYRTTGGGSSFQKLVTIADNTTLFYDDNIPDSSLGVTAPVDNGVPAKYNTIVYHQGRIFTNDTDNPNYLRYSNLNNPYTFESTNFRIVGDNTSDLVRGICVYENSILITCEKSIWLLYMPDTDDSTWELVRTKSSYGSKSPYSLVSYDNKVLVPSVENDKFVGFAAMVGTSVEPTTTYLTVSSAGSELKSDRIEPDMFLVQDSSVGEISGAVFKNRVYLSLPYNNTDNNRIYVMDFSIENLTKDQREAWVPWTTWKGAFQFTIYNGNLYYASSDRDGRVFKLNEGVYADQYYDSGTLQSQAIDSYFWTKEYPGYDNEINFTKDFRFANLFFETSGDYFMDFLYRVDSDSGGGNKKVIDLDPGGSLWGNMIWGVDLWGGGSMQKELKISLSGSRGKRIQFKFSNQNTVNQKFKVLGLNFNYNLKGYR